MSIFGKDALDYIIAITLKSLRKYRKWLDKNRYAPDYSPTYDELTKDCKLNPDDAMRLIVMLHRRAPLLGLGASVLEGNRSCRYAGEALPLEYKVRIIYHSACPCTHHHNRRWSFTSMNEEDKHCRVGSSGMRSVIMV